MTEEYRLPSSRIRSAYEAFLDDGGTDEELSAIALKQDMIRSVTKATWKSVLKATWKIGDIFRVVTHLGENLSPITLVL